jgi:hypothetical protein
MKGKEDDDDERKTKTEWLWLKWDVGVLRSVLLYASVNKIIHTQQQISLRHMIESNHSNRHNKSKRCSVKSINRYPIILPNQSNFSVA